MTFEEAYSALEDDFRQRVEGDKHSGMKCIFLPNIWPTAPVEYVLIGMEPSLGRWAKGKGKSRLEDAQRRIDQGFRNFCGVWILHYPVRTFLCQDGESYYITDLAKGAMPTNEEGSGNEKKYDEWYPLLEKELGLVAKPDAKIISIRNKVGQLLSKMGLTVTLGRFLTLQVEPHATGGKKSRAGRGSLNTGSSPLGSTQSQGVPAVRIVAAKGTVSPSRKL